MPLKQPRARRFIKAEEPLDIVAAMNHRALFAQWFDGESWDGWRSVLKATFGLAMTESEVAFFRSVSERSPPPGRVRELWVVAGRRAGKDSIASLIATYAAVFFNVGIDRLRPGEKGVVMCLATDREQAAIVLNYIKSYFDFIPPLRSMIVGQTSSSLQLCNDVDIQVVTNSYRSVRGRAVLCAIFDECAYWQDERSARPDTETYAAIKPGLVTLPGSVLIGISTGHKKSGLLWSKYKAHYGRDDDDVLVIKASTVQLNPTVDRAVIEKALLDDPQVGRSEWLGEFRDDISSFIDPETVEVCVVRGRRELPPVSGTYYSAFCDPSGGSSDSMSLAVCHRDGERVVLDCLRERKPPFSPDDVVAEFAATLKSYNIVTVSGDRYAGLWPSERFKVYGITYEPCEQPKSDLYRDLLPLLNSKRVELLDHPRLVSQLVSLERRTVRGGRDSIDHPPNAHDDVSNAAAGGIVLAGSAGSCFASLSDAQWQTILADVGRYRYTPSPRFP